MTTIANVNLLIEAHLIRAALEGSGIAAYIPDELTVQAASPYAFAIGGIRVQVENDDAASAREIIAAIPPALFENTPFAERAILSEVLDVCVGIGTHPAP